MLLQLMLLLAASHLVRVACRILWDFLCIFLGNYDLQTISLNSCTYNLSHCTTLIGSHTFWADWYHRHADLIIRSALKSCFNTVNFGMWRCSYCPHLGVLQCEFGYGWHLYLKKHVAKCRVLLLPVIGRWGEKGRIIRHLSLWYRPNIMP